MSRRSRAALLAAGALGLGLAGAAAAQGWGPEHRRGPGRQSALSPEDRAAFAEARIAALHAGLALTPDQEKLWPPVEAALRDMAKLRRQQREARRDRPDLSDDAPAALRAMADATTARGEALRKLADAAQRLYAALDPAQKRRAMILARPISRMGGPGGRRGGFDGGRDMPRDGGPGGDRRPG